MIMRRSKYLQFLDAKFESEFGPKLRELREINQLALTGEISEQERLSQHERLFPGFSKVERLEDAAECDRSAKSA
jgi:hypothetical protein